MASPFFMKETGLRKDFSLVRPTERVADVIRVFWRQEFRQSVPFLTPGPPIAVVTVERNTANLPWATIILPFIVEHSRFRPKESESLLCEFPSVRTKEQAMVLRTALMSLAALAVCQIGYGQSGTPQAPAANANPSEVHSESNQAATATPSPAEMNGPQMDYGLSTMPGEESTTGASCNDGSCAPGTTTYRPWWHRHLLWSYWKCHGLPSPWNPPGNLTLHVPYCNSGSTYYYFRPYNCLHISAQQAEAANDNGDPRNPYNNRVVFDGLYDGL